MKERARPADWAYYGQWDGIEDKAATRLAELRDLKVADQALWADSRTVWQLREVFSSPEGREYLLKRIGDHTIPVQHRLALVRGLDEAGGVYRSSSSQAATRPWPAGTPPDLRNSSYLTRIANLAVSMPADDEQVSVAALDVLERLAGWSWSSDPRDPEIEADANGAAQVLKQFLLRQSTSDLVQYHAAKALAHIHYGVYSSIRPACGAVLTLAHPLDLTHYGAPNGPSVLLGYEFACTMPYLNGRLPATPPITAAYLILDPLAGGKSYALPTGMIAPSHPAGAGSGSDCVPLPQGFTPGKYRLHYRLMGGSKVISDGYGFETVLPQPELAMLPKYSPPVYPAPYWRGSWTRALITSGIIGLALLLGRRFVRSRRRIGWFRNHHCHLCGYDLRASRERCPECGTAIPSALPVQVFRRALLRATGGGLVVLTIAASLVWARSYMVSDGVVRTTLDRSDAVFAARGKLVVEWFTPGSDLGWVIERAEPSDIFDDLRPSNGDWHFIGFAFKPMSNTVAVPFYAVLIAFLGLGLPLLRTRSKFLTIAMSGVQTS